MTRYAVALAAFWLACPTLASTPEDNLKATKEALQEQQVKAKELDAETRKVNKELDVLQAQSDKIVRRIREQQTRIESNRAEIRRLEKAQSVKRAELTARRDEIASLLQGIIRLKRLPQHYAATRPGNMQTLLHTASALDITYDAAQVKLQELEAEFQALAALSDTLNESQSELAKRLASVKTEQDDLLKTVTERRTLQQSLRRDHAQVTKRVHELSSKSNDLQELIARLESETRLFNTLTPKAKPALPRKEQFAARKGNLPYPAQGKLLHRYGEKRGADDKYRGALMLTSARAPVTTPHEGTVMFSGTFMDYGPMVIIEHDKDYHSVVAGLDVVQVEPGQPVARGELIGTMGASDQTRRLYFELRKHSKAIDPAPWMGNVSLAARN